MQHACTPAPPAGASFALAMGQAATVQEAAGAACSALAAYDSQRQWGDRAALLDTAAACRRHAWKRMPG